MKALGYSAVLLLCACVSAAAQLETRPVMHRQWVEDQDANGLYPARSTDGHFSVVSPIPFNDYSIITENDPNIGRIVMHGIGSRSTDGYEFGTLETERTPRMKDIDLLSFVHDFAAKRGEARLPASTQRIGTEEVVRVSMKGRERSAEMRWSKTEESVFQVICDYPTAEADSAASICADYLASFRIER